MFPSMSAHYCESPTHTPYLRRLPRQLRAGLRAAGCQEHRLPSPCGVLGVLGVYRLVVCCACGHLDGDLQETELRESLEHSVVDQPVVASHCLLLNTVTYVQM